MADTKLLSKALDALADELEPQDKRETTGGRRRRGTTSGPGQGEAVLQVVERDGVHHAEEAGAECPN